MKKFILLILLTTIILSSCFLTPPDYKNKYFVYQLQNLDINEITTYPIDYLVMDYTKTGKEADKYTNNDITKLKAAGIIPIAYISIGETENGEKIKIIDSFNTGTRASFVEYSNAILWAGKFYHAGNYTTNISHHLTTNIGTKHFAWIAGFKLNPETDNISKNKDTTIAIIPDMILSIPDIVQDIEFLETRKIILSRSYGRTNDSILQIYSSVLNQSAHKIIQISGKKIPVWFLDKLNLEKEIIILPMSEGITQKNNSLYILFESVASKYRFTTKYPTDYIWRLKLQNLINNK